MNEHIEKYCVEYIESKNSPQFAIFLKGEWGCGKTYFIKKIIDRYTEKSEKIKRHEILYLSIFGVNEIDDIDGRIFQKLHPILSSNQFKYITTFARAALKLGINIDFNHDGKSDGIINLGGINNKKGRKLKINDITKKLIVVDDIERTNLDPSQIFGYFSEYLYQLNTKIIFVGNEEHIAYRDEEKKGKYFQIKEKTIGIEFLIRPENDLAINAFIEELSLAGDGVHDYVKDNCIKAMKILNCNNLRTVRQCLYNLKILFNSLNVDILNDHGNDISEIFINLFIQKNLNYISGKDDIRGAIIGYEKHNVDFKKYEELKKDHGKDFLFDSISKYIPLNNCWPEIIFDGYYSKDVLNEEYKSENTVNNPTKQKNLFILLNTWRSMDKSKFKTCIDIVNYEFEHATYLHPGEILHYVNIMLIFVMWGLIEKTKDEMMEFVNSWISKNSKSITPINDWGMIEFSYAGWGYSDGIPEIQEIKKLLKKISEENIYELAKFAIKDDMIELKNNVKGFCRNIIHVNGTNKYYRKPFLFLVDIKYFYNVFRDLNVEDQGLIISSFEERYGKSYSNGEIYQEYLLDKDNLKVFTELYDKSLEDIKYNPKELLKRDISKRLHELIEYFER